MSNVPRPNSYSSDTDALASEVNADFNTLYNDYNGNITNYNISATAAIGGGKLDLAEPGTIGATTPGLATFTNITATSITATTYSSTNDTAADCMRLTQGAVLATNNFLFYAYSNAAQTSNGLVGFVCDNTATTTSIARFQNSGVGHCLDIFQLSVNTGNAIYVYSNAVQVTNSLTYFHQDNASSSQGCQTLVNDGFGSAQGVVQNGDAPAITVDSNISTSGNGAVIKIDGINAEAGSIGAFQFVSAVTDGGTISIQTSIGSIFVMVGNELRRIPYHA